MELLQVLDMNHNEYINYIYLILELMIDYHEDIDGKRNQVQYHEVYLDLLDRDTDIDI